MNARQIRDEIHDYINRADERFLRLVYSMVESEKKEKEFFANTNDEMVDRAKKSLQSIQKGNARSILDFKNDLESWKKKRTIQ